MNPAPLEGLYIGLMSGTSLNSIDCGLFEIENNHISQRAGLEYPLNRDLRSSLLDLCEARADLLHHLALADRQLALSFAEAVRHLLEQQNLKPSEIIAIGSHGQTVRHSPDNGSASSYTVQIGDPNTIVAETGITTVADFRRRDIALGGQGAPLAPAFHQFAFASPESERGIINIGGMANVSCLKKDGGILGFDTGPGNVLMDAWIGLHKKAAFDKNGEWAASGTVIPQVLETLLAEPWLASPPPKSTGRELFGMAWLETQLAKQQTMPHQTKSHQTKPHQTKSHQNMPPADIMATLLRFTAQTIAQHCAQYCPGLEEVFVCGGGAHNRVLCEQLSEQLNLPVSTTEILGIEPDWVEAATFAWLANQALMKNKLNWSNITGAGTPAVYGGIYHA